jgi:tetratricopeptide (TPR) repeat protein
MKLRTAFAALIYTATLWLPLAAQKRNNLEPVTIFYSENEKQGWRAVVRGRVLDLGVRNVGSDEIYPHVQRKTKVTCRMDSSESISPGDELFIINEKHLIVSRVKVVTVNRSSSFGYILVGYGNFRRVQKDFLLVQRKEEGNQKKAPIYKARGDYFRNNGQYGEAIVEYEKAIKADPHYPEAHLEMGKIYIDKKIYEYALKEYSLAYKGINLMYDNQDKYELYKGLLDVYAYNAYVSPMINRQKQAENINSGISLVKEALGDYPQDEYFNYQAGRFYYNNPDSDDLMAKKYLQKTVEINPSNSDALVILGELYYKHKNYKKAKEYVSRALKTDPANPRAQDLYLELEK